MIVNNLSIDKKSTVNNGIDDQTEFVYKSDNPNSFLKSLSFMVREPNANTLTTLIDIKLDLGLGESVPDKDRKALISQLFNESDGLANAEWIDQTSFSSRESTNPATGDNIKEQINSDGTFQIVFFAPNPNPDLPSPTVWR